MGTAGEEAKGGWFGRIGKGSGAGKKSEEKIGAAEKPESPLDWLEESSVNDCRLTEAAEALKIVAK